MPASEERRQGFHLFIGPGTAWRRTAPVTLNFDQAPGPPRTVTARRFCDQQEISLQTATGRSLP